MRSVQLLARYLDRRFDANTPDQSAANRARQVSNKTCNVSARLSQMSTAALLFSVERVDGNTVWVS